AGVEVAVHLSAGGLRDCALGATAATITPTTKSMRFMGWFSRLSCLSRPAGRLLLWPAREACGLVDAAASFVDRHLRVRAERARAINSSASRVRCLDLVRGFARLDPLFEGGNHVERVRALAAGAMSHPRRKKEPVGPAHL